MDLTQKKEIEDTLQIWKGPAFEKALSGRSKLSIASFLQSKGVPKEMAAEAAEEIYANADQELKRRQRPHRIIAVATIIFGVGMIAFGWSLGFVLPLVGLIAIGAGIYWLQAHSK